MARAVPAFEWVVNSRKQGCPHTTQTQPCSNWCCPNPDTGIPRLDLRFVANGNRVRPRISVTQE